jgi:hypothetical protein
MAQCQACGQEIKGKPYLWNGDPRLTLHADLRECGPVVNGLAGAQSMADFFSRNAAYLNGRGEPVLIGEER